MQEREPRRVKRQSSHRVRPTAILSVTRDRMACRGELGSDLSTPPGNQPELEQGRAPPVLEDAISRDRLLAAPALGDPYAQRSILDEARDQRALGLAHHALDEGDVDALGRARGELRLEVLLGLHRLGEHDQARGLSIEAMVRRPEGLSMTRTSSSSWTSRRGAGHAGDADDASSTRSPTFTSASPRTTTAPLTRTRDPVSHCLRLRREAS